MSLSKKNSQEFGQNMAAFRPMTPFKVLMDCVAKSQAQNERKKKAGIRTQIDTNIIQALLSWIMNYLFDLYRLQNVHILTSYDTRIFL